MPGVALLWAVLRFAREITFFPTLLFLIQLREIFLRFTSATSWCSLFLSFAASFESLIFLSRLLLCAISRVACIQHLAFASALQLNARTAQIPRKLNDNRFKRNTHTFQRNIFRERVIHFPSRMAFNTLDMCTV